MCLKLTSYLKMTLALFCIVASVGLIIMRLETRSHYQDVIGIVYSSIYLLLGILDLTTTLITLRKLLHFHAEKKLAPEATVIVRGLDCIKWFQVLSLLFYVFLTVSFFLNLQAFKKIFLGMNDVSRQAVVAFFIYAFLYAFIGILQLINLIWFKK